MVLQLCGLILVAHGIAETRQLFGKPSLLQRIKSWGRDLAGSLRAPRSIEGRAAFTGTGSLTVSGSMVTAKVAQDLDARVAELERRIAGLQETLNTVRTAVDREAAERRAEIATEIAAVRTELAGLRRLMEDYAAGGLSLEMAGLVWLLIGTLVGSLPGELAVIARLVLAARAWVGSLTAG